MVCSIYWPGFQSQGLTFFSVHFQAFLPSPPGSRCEKGTCSMYVCMQFYMINYISPSLSPPCPLAPQQSPPSGTKMRTAHVGYRGWKRGGVGLCKVMAQGEESTARGRMEQYDNLPPFFPLVWQWLVLSPAVSTPKVPQFRERTLALAPPSSLPSFSL